MDEPDLTPLPAARAAALRETARQMLRGWLAADVRDAPVGEIGSIGAAAIAAAADGSRRLAGLAPATGDATAALEALGTLADRVAAPDQPRGWLRRRAAPPAPDLDAALAGVIRQLEQARDDLIRHSTRIATEAERIAAADARLEEAIHLVTVLAAGGEAAAREVAGTDPDRAARLRGPVAEALLVRRGDLLTQLAVTRQGRLSLGIVAQGNATLAAAIDRARATTVAALRTAGAAATAMAEGQRLASQAAALGDLATAAGAAKGSRDAAVHRALADARAQVEVALRDLPG